MSELPGKESESLKQRAIPCLQSDRAGYSVLNFPEGDANVAYYDKAAATSVQLYKESEELVYTLFGVKRLVKESTGSGAVVSPDGLVLTCNHVIKNSSKLAAMSNEGDILEVTPVFQCPESDLALVQVKGLDKTLPYIKLNAKNKYRRGQGVAVFGHPEGRVEVHVSNGEVMNYAQWKEQLGSLSECSALRPQRILSMSCHVERGNSGSPVLNAQGDALGVTFAISGEDKRDMFGKPMPGTSYAIPIETLKHVLKHRPDLSKRLHWN